MKLSIDRIIALNEWAESKKVVPLTVETKAQVKTFNTLEKCLGIKHKWHIGDKYYILTVPVPKSKT